MKNKFLKYRKTIREIANAIEKANETERLPLQENSRLAFELTKEKIISNCEHLESEDRAKIWTSVDLILLNILEPKGIYIF